LVVSYPDASILRKQVPLEDVGFLVLEHSQITLTNGLLACCESLQVAVITCDNKHMPVGLYLGLSGHSLHNERLRVQLGISTPLQKQLWQQTVKAKINNEAFLLSQLGIGNKKMLYWASKVQSGDTKNHEARAAAYFWKEVFPIQDFTRERYGQFPNNLLNYGFAILRAVCARALVGCGLLPSIGLHHANKYNAYCLADDVMEPYRIYVVSIVCELLATSTTRDGDLLKEDKLALLKVMTLDVIIDQQNTTLLHAMTRTCVSLFECMEGKRKRILYPSYA
jgi:CRISP-associated protein Cas1